MRHHEETVEAFTRVQAERPETLGVVLVGSVARGEERADSDVDVYVVVTDEAFARARAAGQVAMVSSTGVAYEQGYVDVKLASPDYLARAVTDGDDATRASLRSARITLDRMGGLAEVIRSIVEVPDAWWPDRVDSFRAQLSLYAGYFLPQAVERGDDFGLRHAGVHACLAAGRLALAKHHRLFRGQKYLAEDLASLPNLPDGFLTSWRHLLLQPTSATADALVGAVDSWLGEAPTVSETLSRFITDNELAWLSGQRPPEFW